MRTTQALAVRMRHLLNKIHPPSPPTNRENQQLLGLLQQSFRKHLDESHPPPQKQVEKGIKNEDNIPLASLLNSSHTTNQYLNSILSHPIIDQHNSAAKLSTKHTSKAVLLFDHAYSESRLDENILSHCIRQYINGLNHEEKPTENEKLGARLNTWLYSSSVSARTSFFQNIRLLNSAVELLAKDELEVAIWDWLRTVYQRKEITAPLDDSNWLKVEDHLVSQLMRLSIRRNQLDDAAQQYVQACQYRIDSGRACCIEGQEIQGLAYHPLASSSKRLAAAIVHHRAKHALPDALFDGVLVYSLPWHQSFEASREVVSIYHPLRPSAHSLYLRLSQSENVHLFRSRQENASKTARKAMMVAILDAVQISIDQNRRNEAQYLLNFAIDTYTDFLPQRQTEEVDAQLQVSSQYAFG